MASKQQSAKPDVSVQPANPCSLITRSGFPHSEMSGSKLVRSSPDLIAAYHVLHRLSAPRHPPDTLITLDRFHDRCPNPSAKGMVSGPPHQAARATRAEAPNPTGHRSIPKTILLQTHPTKARGQPASMTSHPVQHPLPSQTPRPKPGNTRRRTEHQNGTTLLTLAPVQGPSPAEPGHPLQDPEPRRAKTPIPDRIGCIPSSQ